MSYFTKIGNVLLSNGNVTLENGTVSSGANLTLISTGADTILGDIANVKITGTSGNGDSLITDGSGNLRWSNIINSSNVVVTATNTLTLLGLGSGVTAGNGNVSISGNLVVSTATFTGNVSFASNVNVTGTNLSVVALTSNGNVTGAQLNSTGGINAQSTSNIAGVLLFGSANLEANNITSDSIVANTITSDYFSGDVSNTANLPAANIVGSVNNNISILSIVSGNFSVGNVITISLGGVSYQLLAR